MLAGELYRASDPELVAARARCRQRLRAFEAAADPQAARAVLAGLFAELGDGAFAETGLRCDYGWNVRLGAGAFLNHGVVILDCAPVTIGDGAQIGPNVQLLAADHPRAPAERRAGLELAAPVTIGAHAWLGGGAIVCPGVGVGADSIVGAGAVLTRDVPPGVVAAGNPARIVREL